MVFAAFLQAFRFEFVSARTPFVIMVPLLAMIAFQLVRLMRRSDLAGPSAIVGKALRGAYPAFNRLFRLSLAFVGLALTIEVFGHYIGIATFMVFLMRVMGRERLWLSLLVSGAATAVIYLAFERGFNVELYRGLFFRYLQGYRDF